jgi:hypothetical protein
MFVMMPIFSHVRIQGCPYSLLVKSQELPEFSQTRMKPLSKYHHKIPSASHKNELASTVDVNEQRKINREGCNTKLRVRLKKAHKGKGRIRKKIP